MKIGICSPVENILTAQELGYDFLEAPARDFAAMTQEEFDRCVKLVKTADIPCDRFNCLFPGNIRLYGHTPEEELRDYLKLVCGRLQQLGGKILVFGCGFARSRPQGMDYQTAFRRLAFHVRTVCDIAKANGISVAIEPLNRAETDMICSLGEGAALTAQAEADNLGVLADFYHMQQENEALEHVARIGEIIHAHVAAKDRAYPAADNGDYPGFFRQLKRIQYKGAVSIEGNSSDFRKEAARSIEALKKIVSRI